MQIQRKSRAKKPEKELFFWCEIEKRVARPVFFPFVFLNFFFCKEKKYRAG